MSKTMKIYLFLFLIIGTVIAATLIADLMLKWEEKAPSRKMVNLNDPKKVVVVGEINATLYATNREYGLVYYRLNNGKLVKGVFPMSMVDYVMVEKTIYVDANSEFSQENGTAEYPFKTLKAVLDFLEYSLDRDDIRYRVNIKMIGDFELNKECYDKIINLKADADINFIGKRKRFIEKDKKIF